MNIEKDLWLSVEKMNLILIYPLYNLKMKIRRSLMIVYC